MDEAKVFLKYYINSISCTIIPHPTDFSRIMRFPGFLPNNGLGFLIMPTNSCVGLVSAVSYFCVNEFFGIILTIVVSY